MRVKGWYDGKKVAGGDWLVCPLSSTRDWTQGLGR